MLFSYSFGPVTPRITYLFNKLEKFTLCSQNLEIAINIFIPLFSKNSKSSVKVMYFLIACAIAAFL